MPENTSSPSQKGRIFISYRRADSEGYAGRIYDRLAQYFGGEAIFMDVDDIPAGVDFVKYLENEVQSCDVLIALIGKQWLNVEDEHGLRRLDNPNDFVRIEIETALKRDIRVIPVLLGGTQMPNVSELPERLQSLTRRNGVLVYHHSFHADATRLIKHLGDALSAAEKTAQEKAEKEAAEKARVKTEEEREWIIAKEKAESEAAEKAAQKVRLVAEEKLRKEASRQKIEREVAEKAQPEAEELNKQKVAKEKADREVFEKLTRLLLRNKNIIIPLVLVLFLYVIFFSIVPVITKSDISTTPVSPGISDLYIPPFSAAEDIYVYFDSNKVLSTQKFTSRWFLKVNVLGTDLYVPVGYLEYIPVNRDTHLFFHLKNPGISGEYRVDIYMDQYLVGTETFEIYPK